MVYESPGKVFKAVTNESLKYVEKFALINVAPYKEENLDQIFVLSYDNGCTEQALVSESSVIETIYTDESVFSTFGQEACIVLDVALGSGGCEAIVEGFYSVVGLHKKNGKQQNSTLAKRAVVDWCLPHPIACPEAIKEITMIYLDGDKEAGLKKHRPSNFVDPRQRSNYDVGKVIDRIASQTGRCPHVL